MRVYEEASEEGGEERRTIGREKMEKENDLRRKRK